MAEENAAPQDQTEAATPRRMQQAREQGQVALSREVPALIALATLSLVLLLFAPLVARDLLARLAAILGGLDSFDVVGHPSHVFHAAIAAWAWAALPILALMGAAGVGATLLQIGFVLNPTALMPDITRLSPMAGLGRLFGPSSLQRAGKDVIKLAALGFACWQALSSALPALGVAPYWDPAMLAGHLAGEVLRVLLTLLAVQVVITGYDVFMVRFRHLRNLRMSREDVRREMKETDGDPQVKNRIRLLRRQRARKRMMAAVKQSTVVITNPTHYAVALRYDRGKNTAPMVVAKGMDEMAARIRAVAEEHKVPLIANPPLARALHQVPLDTEIPAEHYQAVAELIAYVWRLQGRLGAGARRA